MYLCAYHSYINPFEREMTISAGCSIFDFVGCLDWKSARNKTQSLLVGTTPPTWGNRSPLAAQSKVGYRTHTSVQVWVNVRDRWYIDIGTLDPFHWWAPPPGPVGRPIPWALPRRAASIHNYTIFTQQGVTRASTAGSQQRNDSSDLLNVVSEKQLAMN